MTSSKKTRRLWIERLEERQLLAAPVLDAIAAQDVPVLKSLILPVTASEADGQRLHYIIESSNESVVTAQWHTGNPWMRINVAGYQNPMDFQLLRDLAPITADRIAGLAQSGFYNSLLFHRVMNNFMIQGGDPLGNGTGGTGLKFDDEFHPEAIFTGFGQLAMAKTSDDTNDTQFFITESHPRHLDFNHTIFGQLVRGFDTLSAISDVPVNGTTPSTDVRINSVQMIDNKADAVLTLVGKALGTATITVTAIDPDGNSSVQTFTVNVEPDVTNGTANRNDPFLLPIPQDYVTPANTPLTINLQAKDIDVPEAGADQFRYEVEIASGGSIATLTQDPPNGPTITLTPNPGQTGVVWLRVQLTDPTGNTTFNPYDEQYLRVAVGGRPIQQAQGIWIGARTGNPALTTVATFVDPEPTATASQYTASIEWGTGLATTAQIVSLGDSTFAVQGSYNYQMPGTYPLTVTIYGVGGTRTRLLTRASVKTGTDLPVTVGAMNNWEGAFPEARGFNLSASVDYGDGSAAVQVPVDPNQGGTYALNHAYSRSGFYAVNAEVTDDYGLTYRNTFLIFAEVTLMANLRVVDALGNTLTDTGGNIVQQISEGQSLTVRGEIPVPDYESPMTLSINWYDGTPVETITLPPGTSSFERSHTYVDDPTNDIVDLNLYNIAVTLKNAANDSDPAAIQARVVNVSPTLSNVRLTDEAGTALTQINEGGTVWLAGDFADPGTSDVFRLTVYWGDNTSDSIPLGSGVASFNASHTYADNKAAGAYQIQFTVTDGDSGSASDSASLTVNNVAPTATLSGDASGVRGQARSFTVGGSDVSADASAGLTLSINWGDGSPVQSLPGSTTSLSHIFAAAGTYTVSLTATDKDGGVSVAQTRTIAIKSWQLQPDPGQAGKKALVIGGTAGNDLIQVLPASKGRVKVMLGKAQLGLFKIPARLRVFGGAGNDSIKVDSSILRPVELDGGAGNDTLAGGGSNAVLLGGAGNDSLVGTGQRDLLIGGAGKDRLAGGGNDDLLIAGTSTHENTPSALYALLREWTRTDQKYTQRVAHLKGSAGGLNGSAFLKNNTLANDTIADILLGGTGTDLLIFNTDAGVKDKVIGKEKLELVIDID